MSRISSQMLLDVYGCADDPQRWRQLLDGVCEKFNVRSAVAQIFQRDGFTLRQRWTARDTFSWTHAEQHDAFVNNEENPRTDLRIGSRFRNDVILRDQDVFAANCPHLAKLRSRLSAIGLGQSVAASFPLCSDVYFTLVLHRASENGRPFVQDEEVLLRELVPHLQQMLNMNAARNETLGRLATYEKAMNGLHTGVIVCDAGRSIKWLNEAAAQIVERSFYLNTANGILRCSSRTDEQKLGELVSNLAGDIRSPSSRAAIAFGTGSDAVQIAAFPVINQVDTLHPWFAARERIVLLLSDRGRPPSLSVPELARLFSLSPAEATLTAALCGGSSVSDYARDRGISVGTARIQLKSVLSKTNTRRQADLVRHICASIVAQTAAIAH